ncbi:MAG: efflux RND transporter permease subunit, partial [Acidobacteriota bacterium]
MVRFAVHRRVTMGMILIGIGVMGVLSLLRLPLEFLPANSSSNVSVRVPWPSASPEEVEQRILRPLEDSLGTLENLERLTATASADSGRIDLEFTNGIDMDLATVEVRDRIDRVRHRLPDDVENLRIRRFQTSDIPVLRFSLAADWPKERLNDFAERIVQRRLERLEGVAQVDIRGLRQREIQIRLDADRMRAYGLDARALTAVLRQNHLDVSAGHIDENRRRYQVRVLGQLRSLDTIRELPVAASGLRLGDVAEIVYDYPHQTSFDFLNGSPSLAFGIYKASDANLLAVVERVRAELDALGSDARYAGHSTRVFRDSSEDVRRGLAQLRDAGLLGGLLAILAVFAFIRRLRTTLLVGIAIPVSVVFTFVLMFLAREVFGSPLTLNVISLMGLVLALGMLVDNSIVVIEAIYRRLEQGHEATAAALRGASDVALPILASTATTLCVFVPVVFLTSGGSFFSRNLTEIGTTVCIVMVASLLVALTVVPMAAVLLLGRERPVHSAFFDRLGSLYRRLLGTTLRFRALFLLVAAGLLWGSWTLFGTIERSFMGRTEERWVQLTVDAPRNDSEAQRRALHDEVLGLLDAHRETLGIADITSRYDLATGRSRGWGRGNRFEIYLVDETESPLSTGEVRARLRELMPRKAGVDFRLAQARRWQGGGGLELEILGEDPSVLELLAREVAEQLGAIPGVRDVDLSLSSGDEQMLVQVDRVRAARAGLSTRAVASTVQDALSDRSLAYVSADDREIDLSMMMRESTDDATFGDLRSMTVEDGGVAVPLETLVAFETAPGPSSITRENRQAKLEVTANIEDPRAMGMAMGGVRQIMASTTLPPGYGWSFGRWTRRGQQDAEGSDFALLFALVLVYFLMAALFEHFGHPLAIMASVPFAFLGVGVVMKLLEQPRDNFTELGFVILIGVVVNNAIVLVDHINRLRRDGMSRREAVLQGGQDRLRAILMTAITTIVGLLPMVAPILMPETFGPLEGRAATWAPVGLVILGGLTTSTFLTLMIVPT